MARHWPGCGQSGTPPAPFTAGRCYCPPQAEVFVEIGARARHTPMPAGDCSCRLVCFSFLLLHVFFAVMSSAWRGEPPHPLSPSYSPRGVPPPGPPADGKVWSQGLSVSLALCATFFTTELRLRHLLLRHVFSLAGEAPAPPVSLLIHQGACRPLDPLLLEIASWAY